MAVTALRRLLPGKTKTNDTQLGAFAYMPGGMFDLVLASTFINVLALALPLTLLQVYDRIIPNDAQETLSLMIIGVGVALMMDALLRLARSMSVDGWRLASSILPDATPLSDCYGPQFLITSVKGQAFTSNE